MIGALFFPIPKLLLRLRSNSSYQIISVVIVTERKRKHFDPYDYNCEAYNAAYYSAYDWDFPLTLGFRNAPYDYDAFVNRCLLHVRINQW